MAALKVRLVRIPIPLCFVLAATILAHGAEPVPSRYDSLIAEGRKYDNMYVPERESNRDKAAELYRQAVDLEPENPNNLDVLFRIGQLYACNFVSENGEDFNYPKGIEAFEKIIDRRKRRNDDMWYAKEIQALSFLGETLYCSLQYKKARYLFEQFFEIDPRRIVLPPHVAGRLTPEQRDSELERIRTEQYKELKQVFEDHIRMTVGPLSDLADYAELAMLEKRLRNAHLVPDGPPPINEAMDIAKIVSIRKDSEARRIDTALDSAKPPVQIRKASETVTPRQTEKQRGNTLSIGWGRGVILCCICAVALFCFFIRRRLTI